MKIIAIVSDDRINASVWWRIIRPLTALRSLGHDCTWYNINDMAGVDFNGSLVIIHRIIPGNPRAFINDLEAKGALAIVYSMDDYTINAGALTEYLTACGGLTEAAIRKIIERIPRQIETIELCDAVIVSSFELADMAFDKIPTEMVMLPNTIDESWALESLNELPETIGNSDTVFIGWAGGRRPESDLLDMARAWKRIARDFPQVGFVVAGWQPDVIDRNIPLDRKIRVPWASLETYLRGMQVDIGCCPLADTEFNRGKSPIKYFEYTMAGAAVVASPTIYDSEIISGSSGYIAYTEQDWYDQLTILVLYKLTRKQFQESAYYDVHNYKSLAAELENWEYQLKGLLQ